MIPVWARKVRRSRGGDYVSVRDSPESLSDQALGSLCMTMSGEGFYSIYVLQVRQIVSADKVASEDTVVSADTDTVLLRPHVRGLEPLHVTFLEVSPKQVREQSLIQWSS